MSQLRTLFTIPDLERTRSGSVRRWRQHRNGLILLFLLLWLPLMSGVEGTTIARANTKPTISDIPNQTIDEDETLGPIDFTVDNGGGALDELEFVTPSSTNHALVKPGNIVIGGSGANRTLTVTPEANASGIVDITITVSNGVETDDETFRLEVLAVNDAPAFPSTVSHQTVEEGKSVGPLGFTVSDVEGDEVQVTAAADDADLLPPDSLTLGGSGGSRTIRISPPLAPPVTLPATTTVTITATDGIDAATMQFDVTVIPTNKPPNVEPIPDQEIQEGQTLTVTYTVTDVETLSDDLVYTTGSSNQALVPGENVVPGGSGITRTLTITPAEQAFGETLITVTVSDGEFDVSTSFVLTVTEVKDPPELIDIPTQTIPEDTTAEVFFSIYDPDTAPEDLSIEIEFVSGDSLVVAHELTHSGYDYTLQITPTPNEYGTIIVRVTIGDGDNMSVVDSFLVEVESVNDLPVITPPDDEEAWMWEDATQPKSLTFTVQDVETPLNELTGWATSSNTDLITNTNLSVSIADTVPRLTIQPAPPDAFGSTEITIYVEDADGGVGQTTFPFRVEGINDRPEIDPIDDVTTEEDTPVDVPFTVRDVDSAIQQLDYTTEVSNPALLPPGNRQPHASGTESYLTLTPAPNLFGSSVVTLTVSDGERSASTTFTLTVTPVNDAPTISAIADASTPEGQEAVIDFVVDDVDHPLASLAITVTSSNAALLPVDNIAMSGDGNARSLTMTPTPGAYGESTVTITAGDGEAETSSSFVLTVQAIPTISSVGAQVTAEDTPYTVTVTVDDRDTDVRQLDLSALSSDAALVPQANLSTSGEGATRSLHIVPGPDQWGTATITVTVTDADNLSASTSFALTVDPVDDPPTFAAIEDQIVDQDDTLSLTFTIADVDTPLDQVDVTPTSDNPTLVPVENLIVEGSGASRTLTATPAAGRVGVATITLTADDGTNTTSQSFVLTVSEVPGFGPIDDVTMPEDTSKEIRFTVSDPGSDAPELVVTAESDNPDLIDGGGLVLTGEGTARALTITPNPDQHGTAEITLHVSDGRLTGTTRFQVTVTPVNDAPTISAIAAQTTQEDVASPPVSFVIGDVDTRLDELELFASSSNPALVPHTSIVLGGTGAQRTISATPVANASGTTEITVTVSDGALTTSTTFTLTVTPVNDAPTVAPVPPQETIEDQPVTITLTLDDIDSDVDDLTLSAQSTNPLVVSHASFAFGGTGRTRTLVITPEQGQAGVAHITVIVSDGTLTGSTSFDLTVINVNDGPTIAPIGAQTTDEDTLLEVPLRLSDPDTDAQRLSVSASSSNVRLIPNSNLTVEGTGFERTLRIQPAPDRSGAANVTVRVSDGEESYSVTFRVDVFAVNDAPVAQDDTYTVITTPAVSFGVLANDFDVDGNPLTVVRVSQGRVGRVSINRDNTIRYEMPPGFVGRDTFTYAISDGRGQEDSATVTVIVVEPAGPDTVAIDRISPNVGLNDRAVAVTVTGVNFAEGATVHLGPYPLNDVRRVDERTIRASVPAFLTPGLYDVIVTNPDGRAAVRTNAYRVHTDKIALITLRPDRGQQDLPVQINVYGLNFDAEAVVFVDEKPLRTSFVSSKHLQATVPAGFLQPGRYAVTVENPDGSRYTAADVYTVHTGTSDDLFGYPYELWTAPGTLHAGQSVQLGLRVHRQVGEEVLTDVAVDFYEGTPYRDDAYLGRASIPLLAPGEDANTGDVLWTPPAPGSYTIYAVIDPEDGVPESDEHNNLVRRAVTVLPTTVDMTGPTVTELVIDDGATTTDDPLIEVRVKAKDDAGAVRAIYLVEYEYIRGADQWVPVQWSDWLDYDGAPTVYDWTLLSSPGARYIQAWAADENGNVSTQPAVSVINFAPGSTDAIAAGEVRLYRYQMRAGDLLNAFLMPDSGDPDLYVWPPDYETRPAWITNLRSGVDEIGFVAPVEGTYQLEVAGYTDATYRSVVELHAIQPRGERIAGESNIDPSKPRRATPYIPVFDVPAPEYRLPSAPPPPGESAAPEEPQEPEPEPVHTLFLPGLNRRTSPQRSPQPAGASGIDATPIFLPLMHR